MFSSGIGFFLKSKFKWSFFFKCLAGAKKFSEEIFNFVFFVVVFVGGSKMAQ